MKKVKFLLLPKEWSETGAILLGIAPVLIAVVVWLRSCRHPFFWDTIQLASRQAQWYYDQHFKYLLLPDAIDSGHPSGFGMYLALCWRGFGQLLLVSHLAILPFVGLILMGLFRLSKNFNGYSKWFFPVVVAMDPVFLGQISLVSPDVALFALFIWGLAGVLEKRSGLLFLCSIVLAIISLRGMMAVLALYFFYVVNLQPGERRRPVHWLRSTVPFIPAGLLALAFLGYHAWAKSWIGFHADSPWRESFTMVGFKGMLKNGIVLAWRIADYGRVFLVLATLTLAFKQYKTLRSNPFFSLVLITLFIQVPHFLLFQGVSAHRYLLPFYLALHLFFFMLLQQSQLQSRVKSILLGLVLLILASGNFWVYPTGIAQGWDSTPAHWPHFAMRKEVIQYLDQHSIALEEVGTTFPEIGPLHWRDLNGRQDGFSPLNLSQNEYVYFSSVMNDFSEEDRKLLFEKWTPVLTLKRAGLKTILFKKP
ncbi:MAG: hypothetical protein SFV55_20055 [Haliscomenobacter sp.]|uniref:hypothetical protein n=1 Tax=Haliscomenobacter sp. TaxID=2717303 RepID=UPI0029AE48D2|nr:hypothetical protein [Haliscomenobacter sp.]MDX2070733.1 hypothetical protein [Haliscomenobacter sp.]